MVHRRVLVEISSLSLNNPIDLIRREMTSYVERDLG